MVRRHLAPWIQNPQSSSGSTGPSKPERQAVSAPLASSKKSVGPYPWILGLTVILCCLLLIACIVLGVLYDKESKNNVQLTGQNENFTLENNPRCNETSNITACNPRLEEENLNMSRAIAVLEQQNKNLTELNAQLQRDNWNLSDANGLLKGEVERLSEENGRLHTEKQQLLDQNSWLQEERRNLTQRNAWLERENQNLSDANGLLRDRYERAQANSTLLQQENRRLLDQNSWLQNETHILTHQRARLVEEIQSLTDINAKLQKDTVNRMDQYRELYQKYASLDKYCPVVNQETQERLCKKCWGSWIHFRSKCYFFPADTKSWNASRTQCKTEGADLLVVNSVEEQKFAFRTSQAVNKGGTRVWIGLTDEQNEGEWRWVDGSLVTEDLQFWFTRTNGVNEPDDWKMVNPLGEDCGHLDTAQKELTSWMDGSCDIAYRWICEKSI